jgi:amino acid transporter
MADIEAGQPLLRRSPSNSSLQEETPPESDHLRSVESRILPETSVLGRNLSWMSAYVIVISRVIGTGIFATPGVVFRSAGSVGLSILLWLLGAVLAACGLVVSLEYGCMLPRSGGDKVYLEFTYPKPRFLASTLVAVQYVLLGFTATNCMVFSEYTLHAFRIEASESVIKAVAVGLLASATILHGCFLKTGILLQNIIGMVKIVLIAAMACIGIVVLLRPKADEPESERFSWTWDEVWKDSEWGWGVMSTVIFKVTYAYAGADNVNAVLNEVRDPVKTLRSVTMSALWTSCIFYLILNFAYFSVVPLEKIKESGELVAALFFERVFGLGVAGTLLPLAVALSAAGNVLVVTFTKARLNQEIARQGFLPFASILASSKPFGAPLGGLVVHFIPSCLVIILPPAGDVFNFILDVDGYPIQYTALAVSIGLLLLRTRRPDLTRPYKAWLPLVWLRILLCLGLIVAPFIPPKDGGDVSFFYATYALVGISIIIFAFSYWYFWIIWLPRRRGYRMDEQVEVLSDGTSITKLVHVKND